LTPSPSEALRREVAAAVAESSAHCSAHCDRLQAELDAFQPQIERILQALPPATAAATLVQAPSPASESLAAAFRHAEVPEIPGLLSPKSSTGSTSGACLGGDGSDSPLFTAGDGPLEEIKCRLQALEAMSPTASPPPPPTGDPAPPMVSGGGWPLAAGPAAAAAVGPPPELPDWSRLQDRVQALEQLRVQVAELKLLPRVVDAVSQKVADLTLAPAPLQEGGQPVSGRELVQKELQAQDEVWEKLLAVEEMRAKMNQLEVSFDSLPPCTARHTTENTRVLLVRHSEWGWKSSVRRRVSRCVWV